MSRVIWHTTMSLDGFIAGPGDSMDWAFERSSPNELANEIRDATGAILGGRRWHDVAMEKYDGRAGIYGGKWEGPVFVLTHEPPEDPPDPEITFLTDGIEGAVATAAEAAGGGNLQIFGASMARQCLHEKLLDEIVVHIAPVLLGDGVRFYDAAGAARVDLEPLVINRSGAIADLRYAVGRAS